MMKSGLFALVAAAMLATPAAAQVEAKRGEGAQVYRVVMLDIAPNKIARWEEIVEKFNLAAENSGTAKPQIYHAMTGPWDRIIIFPMEEGAAEMDWEISPSDAKWRNEMIRQEGSAEAARALNQELQSLVLREDSYITHLHTD